MRGLPSRARASSSRRHPAGPLGPGTPARACPDDKSTGQGGGQRAEPADHPGRQRRDDQEGQRTGLQAGQTREQHSGEPGDRPTHHCIPIDDLPDRLNELPADTEIVAYCRGAYCVFAPEAVRLLTSHGMNAKRLADGMLEWQVAGLPVESGSE